MTQTVNYGPFELVVPVPLMGSCAGCGKGIPWGYLVRVSKYKKIQYGSMWVSIPDVIWCKGCGHEAPDSGQMFSRPRNHVARGEEPKTLNIPPVEIANRLLRAIKPGKAYSSRKAARIAKLRFAQIIPEILALLAKKGKLKKEGNKWARPVNQNT